MPDPSPDPRRLRRTPPSKAVRIGVGLLFTLGGLALLSVLLPVAPGKFATLLPVAGAGMLLLWLGGIWMGVGSRS